jgi:hypothetical protein
LQRRTRTTFLLAIFFPASHSEEYRTLPYKDITKLITVKVTIVLCAYYVICN